MDRHGPFHLGKGQAVALIGDDLGGSALANAIDQRRQHFKGSALFAIIGIGRGADSLASTEDPVQMELFILAPAPHLLLTIM